MSGSQSPPFTSALNDPFDPANADNLHQPGFLGVSPDVWRSLAGFGGNMAAAANARTPGGFLAYGPGFAGPFGAAIGASQQQGLSRAQTLSDIGLRGAQTQGLQIQNSLQAVQAQLQMRMMFDPQFRQQMMSNLGMNGGGPLAASGGATGGAVAASGDTPQGGTPYSQGILKMEGMSENPAFPAARGGPLGAGFIQPTREQFQKENPQYFAGKSPDEIDNMWKTDPQLNHTAIDWYAAKNAPVLKAAGIDTTPQNLGIAHAFGGAGAAGILKFPDNASLPQVLAVTQPGSADAILRENPQYQRMTVGDLKQKYAGLGAPQQPFQVAQAGNGPLPIPSGGQQTATATPSSGGGESQQPGTPQQQPPQQSAAQQQASDMMARANAAEQQANQLEQQRSSVTAENVRRENMAKMFPTMAPFITPLAMPAGDPAAMRTEAQQLRQSALQLQTAGPIAFTKAQNSNLELRQGGMVGIPQGDGTYKYVKNPQLLETQEPGGATVPMHVSPPMPGSPPGTPGEATPVVGENGQPIVTKLPANVQEARDVAFKDFATKDTDAYISAQNTQSWLEQMKHSADTLNASGGILGTGPTSPERITFANNVNDILRSSGLPEVFDPKAVGAWEELNKATTTAGFELSSHYEGHARQAAATIMNATSAVPSSKNTPMGFATVSAGIQESSQQAIDLHNFKQQIYDQATSGTAPNGPLADLAARQRGDLTKGEVAFYQQNPAQMYARRAISTVTPYKITGDKELTRYLPGTFVNYNGKIVQVPERAGAPPIPEYLKGAAPYQGGGAQTAQATQ